MPYSGASDPSLPEAVRKLPPKRRRQWVAVWNDAYGRCQAEGGKDCEATAFRAANAVAFKERQYVESEAWGQYYRNWQMIKSDRAELSQAIHKELLDAYEIGLQDQVTNLGMDKTSAKLTNRAIQRRLKGEANRYAVSMHRTYNRELKRALRSLEAGGKLNTAEVNSWFASWQDRKAEQAAAQVELSGYNQATTEFAKRNASLLVGSARIGPSTAGEPLCAALLGRNPYQLEEMQAIRLPLHIGCVHSWSTKYDLANGAQPNTVWMGGTRRS